MRVLPTLSLLVPLLFGTGCFVFDEIDAGMEIMESHSPEANKKKAGVDTPAAAATDGEQPPTYQELVHGWWKDAKSINVSPDERRASDDPMVPCAHAGRTVYTKHSDCVARGGRPG